MAVLGVDGWRGRWLGALLTGRTVQWVDSRGRPMRICW